MIPPDDIRQAKAVIRAHNREKRAARAEKVVPVAPGQRQPRMRDPGYLAWLHQWPCIACEIEGSWVHRNGSSFHFSGGFLKEFPVEACHQKHTDIKGATLGKRPSDAASCGLCSWHHRLAPNACDPAQSKFWARLGIDVGAFCRALFDCYKADGNGAEVVRRFARENHNG